MKRKLPAFKTDEEAARFLDWKDLSEHIHVENMVLVSSSSARQRTSPCALRLHYLRP